MDVFQEIKDYAKANKKFIILATILVVAIYVSVFSALLTDKRLLDKFPVFDAIVKALLGAGAVAFVATITTGLIVAFQSIITQSSKRNHEIFVEKIALYKQVMTQICNALKLKEDEIKPQIDSNEELDILTSQLKIVLLAEPETLESFSNLVNSLSTEGDSIDMKKVAENLMEFSSQARLDLGIYGEMTAKEKSIMEAYTETIDEVVEKIGGYGSRFSNEKGKFSESELSNKLSNYLSNEDCKTERAKRAKEKLNIFLEILLREDRPFKRKEITTILEDEKSWISHFHEDWKEREYKNAAGNEVKYQFYVGQAVSMLSKVFTKGPNDFLRQIVTYKTIGRTEGNFEVKENSAGAKKDDFYVLKEYRKLLKEILNK